MRIAHRLASFVILCLVGHTEAPAKLFDNKAGKTLILPKVLRPSVNVLAGATASDDCDEIRFLAADRGDRGANFTLRTGLGMWDKKVELFIDGRLESSIAAAGNGGQSTSALFVNAKELSKAQLVLLKPKAFGVMTAAYQLIGARRFTGKNVQIWWVRDRC